MKISGAAVQMLFLAFGLATALPAGLDSAENGLAQRDTSAAAAAANGGPDFASRVDKRGVALIYKNVRAFRRAKAKAERDGIKFGSALWYEVVVREMSKEEGMHDITRADVDVIMAEESKFAA